MLGLIGWGRSSSDAFTLIEFITASGGAYLIDINGPWSPQAGDVFTDANGLSDTVVKAETPGATTQQFFGRTNHTDPPFASGQCTIVRRVSVDIPHTVNFRGIASAVDNSTTRSTDLTPRAGNVIEDSALSADVAAYAPTGWAYASEVVVVPQTDLVVIQGAHWHAPQGVKALTNGHATNRFIVESDFTAKTRNNFDTGAAGDPITVAPGESVAVVRFTQGASFKWIARRNSPLTGPAQILGSDVTAWWNTDVRVDGTPPDITTLTNYNTTVAGDVTQATDANRPHLTSINGKDWAEFTATSNMDLAGVASSPFFYPAAATAVTVWITVIIDDYTATWGILELGTGAKDTGIHIGVPSANSVAVTATRNGGSTTVTRGSLSTGTEYRIRYEFDGANDIVRMSIDNDAPTTTAMPASSNIVNAADNVSYGSRAAPLIVPHWLNGKIREAVVMTAIPTTAQSDAMDNYLSISAGVTT